MDIFSDRLQYVINYKKMSPKELADKIGCDSARMHKLLHGKVKKPQAPTLRKIVNATGCNFSWLQKKEGKPFPNEKTALLSEISYPESKLIENQPPKTQALDPGYGYSIKEDSFKKLAAARFAPIVEWMADDFDCNPALLEEFMNDFMEKFKSENAAYRHWFNNQTRGAVKKTAGSYNTNRLS